MKLKVDRDGILGICSIDLDKIKTDIKWVETDKRYFILFEERDGFLVPVELREKPGEGKCAEVRFEVIYKSYALADFGIEPRFSGKDSVEVEISDGKFVIVG